MPYMSKGFLSNIKEESRSLVLQWFPAVASQTMPIVLLLFVHFSEFIPSRQKIGIIIPLFMYKIGN